MLSRNSSLSFPQFLALGTMIAMEKEVPQFLDVTVMTQVIVQDKEEKSIPFFLIRVNKLEPAI